MRTWERVTYQERCGNCGNLLSADSPMQTITRHGLNRKLIRCVLCAEGEPPADLPIRERSVELTDRVARMKELSTAMPTRTRGALKKAAVEWMPYRENREPGDDD